MHKIKLPTEQINNFISVSSLLKTEQSDTMPYNVYIKFEIIFGVCIMTKINFSSYCTYQFPTKEKDVSFIVQEKKLKNIVTTSTSELLNFHITEEKVTIKDGYLTHGCSIEKGLTATNFPTQSKPSKEFTRIDKPILSAFNIAKSFSSKDELTPQFHCIYVKNNDLFSSNYQSIYVQRINNESLNIAITQNECSFISKFEYIDYYQSVSHNVYKNGNITYGCRKSDSAIGYPYQQLFNGLEKTNYIKIKTSDIINFCTSTIGFAEAKILCNSRLITNKDIASLIYKDNDINEENVIQSNIELIGEDFEFVFDQTMWRDLIKSLPYENICISNEENRVCIWNEHDEAVKIIIMKSFQ